MHEPQAQVEEARIGGSRRRRRRREAARAENLAGARAVLLVGLWNRWVARELDPGGHFLPAVAMPVSYVFPERGDAARAALDLAEYLAAVCNGTKFPVMRGSTFDRFLVDCFPEGGRSWAWEFVSRPEYGS